MKIVSEDKIVESRTSDLLVDWEKDKPEIGRHIPNLTLSGLENAFNFYLSYITMICEFNHRSRQTFNL